MKADEKKIEILVVSHKPSIVPANNLLKPIQVGAELSAKKIEGMAYCDNEGPRNISDKNRSYCELTATYWAWKNIDADYYGLFHYRRYLSFAQDDKENPYPGRAYQDLEAALPEINLDEQEMRKVIQNYDLIVPRKDSATQTTGHKSIYEQYKNEHNIEDLDYCLTYIKKKYPDIAPYTEALHSSEGYFCNMFIMQKELFNKYCSFVFDVLEHFEKGRDVSSYNVQQYRVHGYLAERLTNIFIHYVLSLGEYKVKELQMVYLENTDPSQTLEPLPGQNNVAIVLAADNFYVPYMSTLIHSLAEHATDKYTYDINIFHQDITPQNMSILREEFANRKNIKIRFYDMSSRASEYKQLMVKWHFTVETYFRLFIQDIMSGYDKVLYLDGDLVIKDDVAKLYNEDVTGNIIAAVRDVDMAGVYNSNLLKADNVIDPKRKAYIDNELKIKKPFDYFQAGVLLINLAEMRKAFSVKEALSFAASRHWEYQDQDVLNYLAQGKVKYLDPRWNVLYDWEFVRIKNVISKAPVRRYLEYMDTRKDPKIIHYGGTIKPWQRPDCDFGEEYWRVARRSAYYELILSRMSQWQVRHLSQEKQPSAPKLRPKVVHQLRKVADKIAPAGTARRKPITTTSKAIKKAIR